MSSLTLFARKSRTYLLTAALFAIALLVVSPFVMMVSTSLKTPQEVNAAEFKMFPQRPIFLNYAKALSRGNWARYFFNSVFVTTVVTLTSLLFNSMAGFAFARLEFRFRNFLFYSVLLGLMIAPQLKIVPTFIIMKYMPLTGGNNFLGQGGTGLIDTYAGLMINLFAGPFGIFLCRQYYLNFPKALDDAAEMDGCGVWKRYWSLYIPNSLPLLISLGTLKMTYTWNDYIWPLVITQSERIMTVQLGLALFKDEIMQWEQLMAVTTAVMLPIVLFFLFAQKYFVSGVLTSGMKG